MTEEELLVDRYNRFRKIGEYREFLVKGARVEEAEARRRAAKGVYTKSGHWAEVRFTGHVCNNFLCPIVGGMLREDLHKCAGNIDRCNLPRQTGGVLSSEFVWRRLRPAEGPQVRQAG
jgi:hypothetical protein